MGQPAGVAVKDVFGARMGDLIAHLLDDMARRQIGDRRNSFNARWLMTELGDIELSTRKVTTALLPILRWRGARRKTGAGNLVFISSRTRSLNRSLSTGLMMSQSFSARFFTVSILVISVVNRCALPTWLNACSVSNPLASLPVNIGIRTLASTKMYCLGHIKSSEWVAALFSLILS